ncbi:MAG: restriction endonuclease subunit S [Owenweeksia sp.]|nr:restriction endonuclease subunit S [Owenweeksia sp.]
MKKWKVFSLGDISESCLGKMLDANKNRGEYKPYLSNKKVQWGRFDLQGLPKMRFEDTESERYGLKRGDLVICEGGEPGRCAIWEDQVPEMKIQKALHRLRVKDGFDNYFIYYRLLLASRLGQLKKYFIGSTIKHLTGVNLKRVEFKYPSYKEQVQISSVLRNLDSKIELNNRINAELEAMAKTIYDYWFVQFDFPFDFAQGKPAAKGQVAEPVEVRPYKNSGGEMVWNEKLKRELPKGWEAGELSDIANITMGQSPPGDSYNETGEGSVFYQGCTDFGPRFPTVRKYTTQPSRFAKAGDILLSVRAPVGSMNIANEDCCIGRGLAALKSSNGSDSYQYEVMKYFKQIFDRRNTDGTTFGAITKNDLFSLPVVIPPPELIDSFETAVGAAFKKLNVIEAESRELASLRDWLLPMLMNGQVKVGESSREEKTLQGFQTLEGLGQEKEYVQDGEVGMAAEAQEQYDALSIPKYKAAFAKQVLGGKIVSLFKDDPNFTHIKFQKLQYLAEQIAEADLNWNYYRQSAGPYDPRFMHSVALKLKRSKWFAEKDYRYYPLEKSDQIEKYYQGYFGPKQEKLQHLFEKLRHATEDQAEIIATLYAVWNNRILKREEISDSSLTSDFHDWSSRKQRYSDDQLTKALEWMREHGFVPRGSRDLIKEKKN